MGTITWHEHMKWVRHITKMVVIVVVAVVLLVINTIEQCGKDLINTFLTLTTVL